MIRPATQKDAGAICAIYNHYVLGTVITFEEEAVPETEMAERIAEVQENFPWIVCEEDGQLMGYAYASKWKGRCSYRYSIETTVYLKNGLGGKGLGSRLYAKLIDDLRKLGLHAAMGGIALPNPASVALHEKFGFKKVAHFAQVGWKFDQWIDVGYWELLL